jgi:hypothetical protein
MPSLKDFISAKKNTNDLLISKNTLNSLTNKISGSILAAGVGISETDNEKFSSEVANLAHSDEVLEKLSNNIGKPKSGESENEFVNRAKASLANILRQKLMKK